MKKKFLAALMSVVIVMSVFACVCSVSAGVAGFEIADIENAIKVCPGTALPLEAPEFDEYAELFSQGWEIAYSDPGDDPESVNWYPYDGSAFPENSAPGSTEVWVRYFVTDRSGGARATSNICTVTLAHTPQGGYEKDALDHWRICAECDGKCDMGSHTSLADGAPETCTVCGDQRSYHLSFIEKLWHWILDIILPFFGVSLG